MAIQCVVGHAKWWDSFSSRAYLLFMSKLICELPVSVFTPSSNAGVVGRETVPPSLFPFLPGYLFLIRFLVAGAEGPRSFFLLLSSVHCVV